MSNHGNPPLTLLTACYAEWTVHKLQETGGRLSASVLVSIPALAEAHTLLISAAVTEVAFVILFVPPLLQMQANLSTCHTQVSCMACAYDVGFL